MDLPALFDSEDSPVRHPFSKSTTLEIRSKVWKLMYLVEARYLLSMKETGGDNYLVNEPAPPSSTYITVYVMAE